MVLVKLDSYLQKDETGLLHHEQKWINMNEYPN